MKRLINKLKCWLNIFPDSSSHRHWNTCPGCNKIIAKDWLDNWRHLDDQ